MQRSLFYAISQFTLVQKIIYVVKKVLVAFVVGTDHIII